MSDRDPRTNLDALRALIAEGDDSGDLEAMETASQLKQAAREQVQNVRNNDKD